MTTAEHLLPEDLKTTLASEEFDANGGLLIDSVKYNGDDLDVDFKVTYYAEAHPDELWRIKVVGAETEKITKNWTEDLQIYSDHILLYEYTDNYIELYYNGKVKNPQKLLADLYETFASNYDTNLAFGYGINAPHGLSKLCTDNNGLFARGAKRILEKYEKCLNDNGVKTNYVNEIIAENKNLKLLIFGDSYFIGKDFIFTKL